MKKVEIYTRSNDQKPFVIWFDKLDKSLQRKIDHKIIQLISDNYSNCSVLKNSDGVKEARIRTASGIRIYFAENKDQIIILLAGGDKDTQKKDIKLAKEYWQDYKQRSH